MPEVQDIRDYRFSVDDRLFFDTNIWLYIYGPLGCSHPGLQSAYSRALDRVLAAGSPIYLDALVLSEFINRFVRIEKDAGGSADLEYKAYRRTAEYREVAEAVADAVKRIDVLCHHCETGFEKADVYQMMDEFCEGGTDFNDAMIESVCGQADLILITHDGDFGRSQLRILSANRTLLNT